MNRKALIQPVWCNGRFEKFVWAQTPRYPHNLKIFTLLGSGYSDIVSLKVDLLWFYSVSIPSVFGFYCLHLFL